MNFLRFFLSLQIFILLMESSALSQLDTIVKLHEITITGTRVNNFNTGHQIIFVDSLTKSIYDSRYLKDVLNQSSPLQINSYGTGVSSISGRGTGEKRTPILWNGFNVQSIQTAGTDVAQIPSTFFENAKIQMGGESALFGSGAVGGIVHLSNSAVFNQGLKVEVYNLAGSYSQYMTNAKVSYSNNNYASSVKVFYNTAKNDFPYEAHYQSSFKDTLIKTKQSNANATQYGFMMNNFLKLSPSQQVNLHFWYQNSDKNIAPSLDDIASKINANANQKDRFIRGAAEWNMKLEKVSFWIRTGLFSSKLDYVNPAGWDTSYSKNLSSITEAESNYSPVKFLKLNIGVNYTYEEVTSTVISKLKSRKRSAMFSSVKFDPIRNFQVTVNIREEAVNGKFIPVTYSAGFEQSLFKMFTFRGNISKNYRLPSFNDLYFKNAYMEGNPDLKPESSTNYETGVTFSKQFENMKMKIASTYFQSKMENWINWAPSTDNPDVWTVFNIDQAEMNGLENILELKYNLNKITFGLKGMHTYVNARDSKTQKHLIYVPENKTLAGFTFSYMGFTFFYQQMFMSAQYTQNGNEGKMNAYSLGNVAINQTVKLNKMYLSFDVQMNNLWDKNYMTNADYPMPGRNYMAGIKLNF